MDQIFRKIAEITKQNKNNLAHAEHKAESRGLKPTWAHLSASHHCTYPLFPFSLIIVYLENPSCTVCLGL